MGKKLDLLGSVFGRLTVIQENTERANDGKVKWICVCSCGNSLITIGTSLTKGCTRSCGCLQRELSSVNNAKHSLQWHPLYTVWINMKARCSNNKSSSFQR